MAEPVNIKGTRNGLVILFDSNAEFEDIKKFLHKKMRSAKGFFKGAKFSLQNTNSTLLENQQYELEKICQEYGLVLSEQKLELPGFYNNSNDQSLPKTEDCKIHKVTKTSNTSEQTLLIKRNLRSGQSVKYGGNVVVLGDVHAGAEIIAEGNVIILGRCKGLVHAGATGDLSRQVIATRLCPTQLRIGTAIVTSPDDEPMHPEIAMVVNGKIIVKKYNPSKI